MKLFLKPNSLDSWVTPKEFKKIDELMEQVNYADVTDCDIYMSHPKTNEVIDFFEKRQTPLKYSLPSQFLSKNVRDRLSKLNWNEFIIELRTLNPKTYKQIYSESADLFESLQNIFEWIKIIPHTKLSFTMNELNRNERDSILNLSKEMEISVIFVEPKKEISGEEIFKEHIKKNNGCHFVRREIHVGSDGSVFPCKWNNTAIGNITQKTYEEILSDGPYIKLRTNIKRGIIGTCINCQGEQE